MILRFPAPQSAGVLELSRFLQDEQVLTIIMRYFHVDDSPFSTISVIRLFQRK
jgi:hypothetical protein